MNPPTLRPHGTERLQRLEGHADALLGRVIVLHIQLGFADPLMPPDAPLLPPPDHRRFYGGLPALRETLVRGCVLDFVGAVSDGDRSTPGLVSLKAVRDKVVAHKELRSTPDGYQFVSPSGLNIPWSEFLDDCRRLGKLCELVGLIVHRGHFVFSHEVEGLLEAGRHLWMELGVIKDPFAGDKLPYE